MVKKSSAKKPSSKMVKAVSGDDSMGMRQTYKQTGEVRSINSPAKPKNNPRGGY